MTGQRAPGGDGGEALAGSSAGRTHTPRLGSRARVVTAPLRCVRLCRAGVAGRYQSSLQQPHRLLLLLHLQLQPQHRRAHRGHGLQAPLLRHQPLERQRASGRPGHLVRTCRPSLRPLRTWGAEAGRSCPDVSISCRKLMIPCSLASDNRVPSSGGPAHVLSFPNFSRLSAVRELASSSYRGGGTAAGAVGVAEDAGLGLQKPLRDPQGRGGGGGASAGAAGEGGGDLVWGGPLRGTTGR